MENPIPYIPLMMSHGGLAGTPRLSMPFGYSTRLFRPGEESVWAEIVTNSGEFGTPEEALVYFSGHFGPQYSLMPQRCLLLLDASGRPAGTATGWFVDDDASMGRLHWVCIMKEHQGKGLCMPLVAETMLLMHRLGHKRALLTTQPKSWRGIRAYLNLGWTPYDDGTENYRTGWELVKRLTGHDGLSEF